jgi:hypothetical protein
LYPYWGEGREWGDSARAGICELWLGDWYYNRLYWTGYALGSAPVNVNMRVLARAVDLSGAPLGSGWRPIGQATIQTPPQRWFRVEIPEGHWDEYRIEVRSATPRLVYSRVIASQGYWKE